MDTFCCPNHREPSCTKNQETPVQNWLYFRSAARGPLAAAAVASPASACTCTSAVPSATRPLLPLSFTSSIALVALAPFSPSSRGGKFVDALSSSDACRRTRGNAISAWVMWLAAESVQSRFAAGAAVSPSARSSRALVVRARSTTNPSIVRWPPRSTVSKRTRFHPASCRSSLHSGSFATVAHLPHPCPGYLARPLSRRHVASHPAAVYPASGGSWGVVARPRSPFVCGWELGGPLSGAGVCACLALCGCISGHVVSSSVPPLPVCALSPCCRRACLHRARQAYSRPRRSRQGCRPYLHPY